MDGPLFFFGAMSPYSWFAAERIDALVPEARWIPIFAGALFRANGRSTWGLSDRRRDGLADCEARAHSRGLGPIRWPDPWPTNDVTVARAMAYSDQHGRLRDYALTAMRLCFLEGADLGDLENVQTAGTRIGIDPERLAQAVAEPPVKDAVRANHDRAISLGVFGVPTVVLADGELFWGDDRLDAAATAIDRRRRAARRPCRSAPR